MEHLYVPPFGGTYLVRQHLLPERSTEVQSLQHRVTVAGVAKLEEERENVQCLLSALWFRTWLLTDTYVDQSKVVFINGELFRSNLLFQGGGIGALERQAGEKKGTLKNKYFLHIYDWSDSSTHLKHSVLVSSSLFSVFLLCWQVRHLLAAVLPAW